MNTNTNSFVLRPSEAVFFEDKNLLFKQDPYVLITIGDQKFKTTVDKKGGLNPHWSDCFNLEGLGDALATIQVYDKDILIPDNLMGEAVFSLNNRFFGAQSSQKMDLFKNEKRVGEITLEFSPQRPSNEVAGGLTGLSGVEYPLTENTDASQLQNAEYPLDQNELRGPKSFGQVMQDVKNDFSTLGHKIGDLGKILGDKLGLANHQETGLPQGPLTQENELQATEQYQATKLDTLNANLPADQSYDSNKPVYNKGNSEYFGQEDSTINSSNAGKDLDNADTWSTVSNQGSVIDKTELAGEGFEKKKLDAKGRELLEQGKEFVEQGKEKLTELGQKGMEKMQHLGDRMTEVFTDRSHNKPAEIPADKPIDLHRPIGRPIHEPGVNNDFNKDATIFKKGEDSFAKQDFKGISELEKPLRGPSADQVIPAEGPKDIDAIDVGPQNFNIDEKFNNSQTLDKREVFENEAIIDRSNELAKESIFDKGFESRSLSQKAEELRQENLADETNKLKLDDNVDFTKPTLSFDNQDTKSQFLDSKVGLETGKAIQEVNENEAAMS